ncbi:MAG: hypothetical protein ACFBRM_04650 [Pikeienuella sp.]
MAPEAERPTATTGRRSTVDGTGAGTGEPWTFRRVPNRIALGLSVACLAAVLFFIMHVGAWGFFERLHPSLFGPGLLIGMPVALLVAFFLAAPALRQLARADRLTRARTAWLGALFYGGVVFLWQLVFQAGPPQSVTAWMIQRGWGEGLQVAVVFCYRHLATPTAFALYGAVAAWIGWFAAFGRARSAPAGLGK